MKKLSLFVSVLFCSLFIFPIGYLTAGAPDGNGPWADAVVSSAQGNTKGGQPVSIVNPLRSNPQAAVGPAELDYNDTSFFSLGFGGSIVLRFDNGVRDGVLVVETTNVEPVYPVEKVNVEVSPDGTTWTSAGVVSQDGQVSMPETVSCVNYVRLTDASDPNDFSEDTADAYDVDGVQALNAESCGGDSGPTPTPTQGDQGNTPTPIPTSQPSNGGGGSTPNNDSKPKECTETTPGTPTITSVEKTSSTTVRLTWTAVEPVTTYAISYGTSAGNYQYGVPSTGKVTSFTVGGLDPNATYYFSVLGINDCKPGNASEERSTSGGQVLGTSTGQVLGATTDVLGATGNSKTIIALGLSVIGSLVSFSIYQRKNGS